MLNESEKYDILKRIIWDYQIESKDIYDFITCKQNNLYHFTREMLYTRILERLSWYEILDCFSIDIVKQMLDKRIINSLRTQSMREKYDYTRRLLFNETLPVSKWYNRDIQRNRYPLLSNRWYCHK
ncbi:MAG: hypothetical protein OMM_10985 [Candidatus Magnetoglobus multicellularis str. Araruama]|uniref:Uncharacterized protein n=1 Tax=Candidatus Magnetoglobus multicellularis str. Araruama TaxID=890399 RepID=A0A1V1NZJ5_9BACT|nr:MAG: hypothetical protein OMM_10985 [Candidatus Magnetoglobus multicellularis str. Araruama]